MGVKLSDLAGEIDRNGWLRSIKGDIDVSDVFLDSRAVTPGSLFCCVEGEAYDGHDFASGAIEHGAVALLVTKPVDGLDVPTILVEPSSVRRAVAVAAATVHGHPSRSIPVIGITGTNGKTTTAAMLAAICEEAGLAPEVFGTLSGARTTAESTEIQRSMRTAIDSGRRIIIMEVTSHALALDRTHGITFRAAVYTNLGHDHLDFHGSIAAYFEAKARLFEPSVADDLIINRDDEHGRVLVDRIERSGRGAQLHTYGIADAGALVESLASNVFSWNGIEVVVPIGGRHNAYNALAAATTARVLGVAPETIARGLASLARVPGRLEQVPGDGGFSVFVDYAHTPDSLRAVLTAARATLSRDARLIVVFGCGGDRDASKRPLMGEVATQLADVVYVTTDNARSEDPSAIAHQIVGGAVRSTGLNVVLDRREAIGAAIDGARSGDVVVIAGKGHERGQVMATVTHDFDDMEEARAAVLRKQGGVA